MFGEVETACIRVEELAVGGVGVNVLEVTDLVKHFTVRTVSGIRSTKHTVQAVSDVSFDARRRSDARPRR